LTVPKTGKSPKDGNTVKSPKNGLVGGVLSSIVKTLKGKTKTSKAPKASHWKEWG